MCSAGILQNYTYKINKTRQSRIQGNNKLENDFYKFRLFCKAFGKHQLLLITRSLLHLIYTKSVAQKLWF